MGKEMETYVGFGSIESSDLNENILGVKSDLGDITVDNRRQRQNWGKKEGQIEKERKREREKERKREREKERKREREKERKRKKERKKEGEPTPFLS